MEVNKTKIPYHLKSLQKIPFCTYRKYRPEFLSPQPLLDICSHITDAQPHPIYWDWTTEDVANWIAEELGYPEFREAFIKNEIDGKGLIFLEADKFPRINVKWFHIIKDLTTAIRNLCKLDQDEFKRSISLPNRKPYTLYLWFKARRTGPTSYYMTPSKYFRRINIIRDEIAYAWKHYELLNHWNRIPSFMPWCPHIFIGAHRRINPMTGTTQRQNFHTKGHPYLLKDLCFYRLPCEEKPTSPSNSQLINSSNNV